MSWGLQTVPVLFSPVEDRAMLPTLPAFALLVAGGLSAPGGADAAAIPGPKVPLPFDAEIRTGTLANGLSYEIDTNGRPEHRAALWLVVKAGSVEEDANQVGVAHFVEHMAFNGTTHFPKQEMRKFLEDAGMALGPGVNGYTAYDETVYQLLVPTDDAALFGKAFGVLAEIASEVSFEADEVERERGVVLEEWRRGRGASRRVEDALDPLVYFGSPYVVHKPIGTEEALRSFAPQAVKRFYDDWYRPDRMTIVAVGDFDPAVVESNVKGAFSALVNHGRARKAPSTALPPQKKTFYNVFADPEITAARVGFVLKHDDVERGTHGSYRDSILDLVVLHAINHRLDRLTHRDVPPCVTAGIQPERLTPTEGAVTGSCSVQEDGVSRGLEALLVEFRRARELGVTEAEVDWARKDFLAAADLMQAQKESRQSVKRAAELVRHVTNGESVPGVDYETRLWKAWIPGIHADEVSAHAKKMLEGDGLVIHEEQPKREGLKIPTEEDLRAAEKAASGAALPPLDASGGAPILVKDAPGPGTVVQREHDDALGVYTWTLSNGARVLVKPTAFQAEEVVFRGWSPGGTSRVPDNRYVAVTTAVDVAKRSGLGTLDADALKSALAGRLIKFDPWIDLSFEGFKGSCTPGDLEAALQMVYLSFVAPRFTQEALDQEKQKRARSLANRSVNPSTVFDDAYDDLMWKHHLRHLAWTVQTLDQMDLEATRAVWKERFGDPADFTFVFVGALDLAQTERLVNAWLGSIPSGGHAETPGDDGARRIDGVHNDMVHAGIEPKARVRMTWSGPFEGSWTERTQLGAVADALEEYLREALREEMGGTYKVSVSSDTWKLPVPNYRVTIDFGCDPARAEELKRKTAEIVASFREKGPDAEHVEREKTINRRSHETNVQENAYWASVFQTAATRGEDPHEVLRWGERNDALSPETLRESARLHLDPSRVVTMTLLPTAATPAVGTTPPSGSSKGEQAPATTPKP
jgi:zinc protease